MKIKLLDIKTKKFLDRKDFYIKDDKAWFLDDNGACGDPECCGEVEYYMTEIEGVKVIYEND